jgi:hypothetical protein
MDSVAANEKLQTLTAQAKVLEAAITSTEPVPWWSVTNAMTMSSAVLGFGVIVLILAAFLIKSGQDTEAVLRTFGTILIIVGALFLVVAGYSANQIAPVMGLLGTIAGYLLGKKDSKKE